MKETKEAAAGLYCGAVTVDEAAVVEAEEA